MQIKKKLWIMVLGLLIVGKANLSYGQWVDYGTYMLTGDKVGIGSTTSPGWNTGLTPKLEVIQQNSNLGPAISVRADSVGRGISIMTQDYNNVNTGTVLYLGLGTGSGGMQVLTAGSLNYGNLILQQSGGNVGIGTTNPQQKLSVNGTIRAHELELTTNATDYPDFVFADNYKLMPLAELEKSIKQNKHLPEIPTAEEVEKNGLSMGKMQVKLLQKVEELTLYLIEQEKKITKLMAENQKLAEKMDKIEK